jgi:hypothetical protein
VSSLIKKEIPKAATNLIRLCPNQKEKAEFVIT